jgi:hypothetical protein
LFIQFVYTKMIMQLSFLTDSPLKWQIYVQVQSRGLPNKPSLSTFTPESSLCQTVPNSIIPAISIKLLAITAQFIGH